MRPPPLMNIDEARAQERRRSEDGEKEPCLLPSASSLIHSS